MTLRPALLLLTMSLAGCAQSPDWSWRQPPRSGDPAAAAPPSAAAVVLLANDRPRPPLPEGPPTWRYGAKFEPPDGRILHGMGNWTEGNESYLAALGDPALEPAASLFFIAIGDSPRPWENQVERLSSQLAAEARLGRMLHLGIELRGVDGLSRGPVPVDVDVAQGNRHDGHIRDLARVVRDVGAPAFVRIGFEFSGEWNGYTPVEYPLAFRRTVEIFREEGADNAAFVWCWEASSPGDFDSREQGAWRWYPGNDAVDWFGIDLFNPSAFGALEPRGSRSAMRENTRRFLEMAEMHGKPVMVAESGAVTVGITPDVQDGRRDWGAWFDPFFRFLADHPGIKAFHYINSDWKDSEPAQANGWQDGDISHNAVIAASYAHELRDPRYLHKAELHLRAGWRASAPQPERPAGRAGGPAAPRR